MRYLGGITIFSAHGVARAVEEGAESRGLPVIDATCPLVSKVHSEGQRYAALGKDVILIGHAGHPEVEGTMGQIPGPIHLISSVEDVSAITVRDPAQLAYVTQTTLSVDDTRAIIDALKARFPAIVGPDTKDICYATQNRQRAVRDLAERVDVLLVVGARNSSNSNRLREIGAELGVPSYLIEDARALDESWLDGASAVGITAGASAPDELVQDLIETLRRRGPVELSVLPGADENVRFRMPAEFTEPAEVKAEPMSIPLKQQLRVGAYVLKQHLKGVKRYPLVLMLEPLFRCNLACSGCGKIDYPDDILNQRLSVAECMEAADDCGARWSRSPVASRYCTKRCPRSFRACWRAESW